MSSAQRLNTALRFHEEGRFPEAEALYRQILSEEPANVSAWYLLGRLAMQFGQNAAALECIGRTVALRPDCAEAFNDIGLVYENEKQWDRAIAAYERAIALKPGYVGAINNLGNALKSSGRADEAIERFHEALRLDPGLPDLNNNLGLAHLQTGNVQEAIGCFQRALAIRPQSAESINNLGAAHRDLGQWDEAAECFARAIALRPDYAEAHFNQAIHRLMHGDFARGWVEYEWRWKRKGFPSLSAPERMWDGRPLSGQRLLLHAEQGFGDTFQFARYAALCKRRGATVVLAAPKPLVRLMASCRGIDELLHVESPPPVFDFHAPLLSLPRLFGTTVETIPADVPYLSAEAPRKESWRQRLGALRGFKIGIAWQGNPAGPGDRYRSIPVREFAPLAATRGVTLVSLQRGPGTEQLLDAGLPFSIQSFGDELDADGAFVDTAAIMANLDLVVTSDTAIAHLAGALAVPTWLALSHAPDWRWMRQRDDTPWYPTLRLFRQRTPRDWQGVFDDMARALTSHLAKRRLE